MCWVCHILFLIYKFASSLLGQNLFLLHILLKVIKYFCFQRHTINSKSINANDKWLLVLEYYSGSFSDCSDSQARGQERRMGLVPKSLKVFTSQPSISLLLFMPMPTCHLCPPKNALLSPLCLWTPHWNTASIVLNIIVVPFPSLSSQDIRVGNLVLCHIGTDNWRSLGCQAIACKCWTL